MDETSTISCSFIDTNYTAMEYEQLRDMLTNNLIYSSPNAAISVSGTYTDAKDYLYVLVADDSAQNYREIYYYVVGDLECFVAEVKEYRDEATAAQENMEDTPKLWEQRLPEPLPGIILKERFLYAEAKKKVNSSAFMEGGEPPSYFVTEKACKSSRSMIPNYIEYIQHVSWTGQTGGKYDTGYWSIQISQ